MPPRTTKPRLKPGQQRLDCSECEQEDVIFDKDDHICVECRAKRPATARVVGEVSGETSIVVLSVNPEVLAIMHDGEELFRIVRADLTLSAIEALKVFVKASPL